MIMDIASPLDEVAPSVYLYCGVALAAVLAGVLIFKLIKVKVKGGNKNVS